ncbi:MAG TPA: hypothetical protein VFS97_05355 [Nitrososphaeraceae archaeon]|nr:hypothetical protein [Nitrososphaeraceae archaeon]
MTKAFAFDLFGTLVDLGSVSKVFSKVSIRIDNLLFAAYLTIEQWHNRKTIVLLLIKFMRLHA